MVTGFEGLLDTIRAMERDVIVRTKVEYECGCWLERDKDETIDLVKACKEHKHLDFLLRSILS